MKKLNKRGPIPAEIENYRARLNEHSIVNLCIKGDSGEEYWPYFGVFTWDRSRDRGARLESRFLFGHDMASRVYLYDIFTNPDFDDYREIVFLGCQGDDRVYAEEMTRSSPVRFSDDEEDDEDEDEEEDE